MSYCAPRKPSFGFLDHGCEVYGGIQMDMNRYCSNQLCSSRDLYIPQHNLAVHWGRPELVPQWNFSRFFCRLSTGTDVLQHVGLLSYDTDRKTTKNRNLLTSSVDEQDDSIVRLWAVKEGVSRRKILCLRQRHTSDEEGCKKWILESEGEGVFDGVATKRLLGHVHENDWHQFEDYVYCRCINVDTPLLELIAWNSNDGRFKILARGETALYLCNTPHFTALSLYNEHVYEVITNPYLNDEITFVDGQGRIWHGPVGNSFTRRKCIEQIEHVASTDHPRVIYAATKEKVSMLDLRMDNDSGEEIYCVPDFDDSSRCSYQYCYEGAFPKPQIHFLKNLHETPQALLIATSQKFILMDERMRGICHLELAHSLKDAGDYLLSAPSIVDAQKNGHIYPIFAANQSASPSVHTFALYRHTTNRMWSSVGPVFRLREPAEVVKLFKEQPKYALNVSQRAERCLFDRGTTRAICCIGDSGRDGLTMVRMLNDGDIWLDEFSLTTNEEEKTLKIQKTAIEVSGMLEEIEESLQAEESKFCYKSNENALVTSWDIEVDEIPLRTDDIDSEIPGTSMPVEDRYPELPQAAVATTDEAILSNIVMNCWTKYLR